MDKNLSFDLSPTLWTPNSNLVLLPLADLCLSLSHTQSLTVHTVQNLKSTVCALRTHPKKIRKPLSRSLPLSLSLSHSHS